MREQVDADSFTYLQLASVKTMSAVKLSKDRFPGFSFTTQEGETDILIALDDNLAPAFVEITDIKSDSVVCIPITNVLQWRFYRDEAVSVQFEEDGETDEGEPGDDTGDLAEPSSGYAAK